MSPGRILSILAADATDGAKIAAIASLLTGKTTARELAEVLNSKLRTVERHNTDAKELVRRFAEVSPEPLRKIAEGVRKSAEEDTQICVVSEPADSCAPATKESPSEIVILESKPLLFPTPFDQRVTLKNGKIVLCKEVRDEWVAEFGDEKDLDLALITAANYVQVNSSRPLEAQVSAQLARVVREKREKDKRYAAAAAAKGQNRPTASAAPPPRPRMRPMTQEERELYHNAGIL